MGRKSVKSMGWELEALNSGPGFAVNLLCLLKQVAFSLSASGYDNTLVMYYIKIYLIVFGFWSILITWRRELSFSFFYLEELL